MSIITYKQTEKLEVTGGVWLRCPVNDESYVTRVKGRKQGNSKQEINEETGTFFKNQARL